MHDQPCRGAEGQEDFGGHDAALRAIINLLQSRNMQPGESINIILAKFEMERKGIGRNAFSVGLVLLLDRGWLDMQGNVFYLTPLGFEALKKMEMRDEQ